MMELAYWVALPVAALVAILLVVAAGYILWRYGKILKGRDDFSHPWVLGACVLVSGSCWAEPAQVGHAQNDSLPDEAIAGLEGGPLAYSPNDTRLAVASSLGIWLYDAVTGTCLFREGEPS